MIGAIFNGVLLFFVVTLLVIFKVATLRTRPPSRDESLRTVLQRLGYAFRSELRRVFASPWLWVGAGIWTALVISYTATQG